MYSDIPQYIHTDASDHTIDADKDNEPETIKSLIRTTESEPIRKSTETISVGKRKILTKPTEI